jgi:hypothetical protein
VNKYRKFDLNNYEANGWFLPCFMIVAIIVTIMLYDAGFNTMFSLFFVLTPIGFGMWLGMLKKVRS